MQQIIDTVRSFGGALVVLPGPGGGFPEEAWGDAFFFHAPDGTMPAHTQPYGTITTRDLPGDTASDLDPPGRWRVNIHVGRTAFGRLVREEADPDHTAADVLLPHPVYGAQGWVCVVTPGERTTAEVLRLLRAAHDAAAARHLRRSATGARGTTGAGRTGEAGPAASAGD